MDNEKKPNSQFDLPYKLLVQYENLVRNQTEFWSFRTITTLLRQNPKQIEKLVNRYHSKNNP